MKNRILLTSLFCLLVSFSLKAQYVKPDTVFTDLNNGLSGRTWQFSFVHLTDVHVGEGVSGGDYGTPGYDDALTPNDAGLPAKNLSNAVHWINENASRLKIKFVAVTGDLTRSGEKSEFLKFKEIADSLTIPYIPFMGNHDMWPYTDNSEAPSPNGDSIINAIFADRFAALAGTMDNWDNGTRLTRTWNTENNCWSYFQNYSFTYGNYLFSFGDFAPRAHAPLGNPGIGPEADIMNFTGGTWQYFQQFVSNYSNRGLENMVFFSHYPLTKDPWNFVNSFSMTEYGTITNFLLPYASSTAAWVAGHIHRDSEYGISTLTFSSTIMNGIETNSNKDVANGHFRIIKVWDNYVDPHLGMNDLQSSSSVKVFPNPGKNTLTVSIPEMKGPTPIEIFSLAGTKVYSGYIDPMNHRINTESLEPGAYFIKLGKETVKWMKY